MLAFFGAALVGSLGIDAGAGVALGGINESGTNSAVFGSVGPMGRLRLHVDDFFVEGDADLAIAAVGAFAGRNGIFPAGGPETIALGSSVGASLTAGYRFSAKPWTLSFAAGPWAGFVPYSCGDCLADLLSVGAVGRVGIAFDAADGLVVEADAELAAGAAELFYYTEPPISVRPALHLTIAWTFGDP